MLELKPMRNQIVIALLLVFFCQTPAFSLWIWTPKTGKWMNPKQAVKSNPDQQLDFVKSLYDIRNYAEAKQEIKKLIKAYPKSAAAAEAQYYMGLVEEAQENYYEAFKTYQKVIVKYPFSERIQEIIERQYKIGEIFMSGQKRKAAGVTLPVENPSIEIFTQVVENSTYGVFAAKAQYKLGMVFKGLSRYFEAEEAFNKVITNYPESEWVEAAKFQLAACRAAVSRSSDYDQEATQEAKTKFEDFVAEHPEAVLSREAEKNIQQLGEKEAESGFNIARFYEKQKDSSSAKIYYQDVIDSYPQSPWAAKALNRIQMIERQKK